MSPLPGMRARAVTCALLLALPAGTTSLVAQGTDRRVTEPSPARDERAARRWPRRVVMPLVMGAAAALAASAYFISDADDPVGSCTGPRCVLPLSVGIGMGVGYLMGREMDNAHALRYRRGAPVRAEGQALALQGEPQWMSVGPLQGAAGGGLGGVQLFSTDGAPRLLARRASGIRGVRALDIGPGVVTIAATTGLYAFSTDSSPGARVRDGDIIAVATLAGRRVVGIGDRLELAPRAGAADTAWRASHVGSAVRAMSADPTSRLLWVATDSALMSFALEGDSLARRATARLAGGVRTVRSDGARVVVAAGERGVRLFDSDDRGTPRERFLWAGARFAYDALITRERVYVAGGGEGLYVLDARASRGTVLGLARQVGFAVALGEAAGYTYVLDRTAPAVHRLRSDFPLR